MDRHGLGGRDGLGVWLVAGVDVAGGLESRATHLYYGNGAHAFLENEIPSFLEKQGPVT